MPYLALDEHRYHAEHTSSGVSSDQPRATSQRIAIESVAAPADDQVQRMLLPPRYGYVGLTVVTGPARGTGAGRALVDELMGWFAAQQLTTAFLHYVVDNRLSSRFWTTRAGFVPHLEIYST